MSPPDKPELVLSFEEIVRRLRGATAFSQLLSDLREGDDEARQLAEETGAALADSEREQQAVSRFAGPRAARRLREAKIGCHVLMARLAEQDRSLSPASLRRALQQPAERPPAALVDLLGFYLEMDPAGSWTRDRVAKIDLLLTRLGKYFGGSSSEPESVRLTQVLAAANRASPPSIGEVERAAFARNLKSIVSEVEAADSISQLIEGRTLPNYRTLKQSLGPLLIHPELLPLILKTNQRLQEKIRRIDSRVLTGIFSIYQSIFEVGLKGGIDETLRLEIDRLQDDFDRFEQRVKQGDTRLSDLEAFWNELKGFAERLEKAAANQTEPEPKRRPKGDDEEAPEDWLADDLEALLDLLRESDQKGWPPEFVSLPPREQFQIDKREVVAFRRLRGEEEADTRLETFLIKAAALRRTIKQAARKLAGVSDAESLQDVPEFAIARQAVRLSESYLARYSQAIEQAVLDGDLESARSLQILRMRLVRESAGIWLQVHQAQ